MLLVRRPKTPTSLGNETRPFAGVARVMVEQELAMTWEEFLQLYP